MERKPRSIFSGVLVITLLVALSAFLLGYALDQQCRARFETALPVYPDAQLSSLIHEPIIYARAEYHSNDVPAEIQRWYERTLAAQLREATLTNDLAKRWSGQWEIEPASDSGSLIILSMRC